MVDETATTEVAVVPFDRVGCASKPESTIGGPLKPAIQKDTRQKMVLPEVSLVKNAKINLNSMFKRGVPSMRTTLNHLMTEALLPLLAVVAVIDSSGFAAAADDRDASFKKVVAPFFERYCTDCHGPDRSKAGVRLHALTADLSAAPGPERWDKILDQLEHQSMPPESSDQPKPEDRRAVAEWIRGALRRESERVGSATHHTSFRRLTNVEYQNTLRDLLGFELRVIDELPKDPSKPYSFTNTPEFMRLGPEQLDAYRVIARRALTAAIVDPETPKPFKKRQEWKAAKGPNMDDRLEPYHLGVWGGPRGSVSQGMTMIGFPKAGEFRVRFQASAKFPAGASEMPLRLVIGEDLNVNSSARRIEPLGMVRLKADEGPKIFELRGRIENFPYEVGRPRDGKQNPDRMTITPQNLYDDGTLNDENGFRKPRMRVFPIATIDWMEFEGPLTEVWPPEHHTRILFESPLREKDPEKYIREVLRRFMGRAFRRPATDDEVAKFAAIYATLKPELKTVEATLRETLSLVMVTPQFLMIHGVPVDETERRFALASKLSYFLWASMPDEELLALAKTGEIEKPAMIEKQVLRMLADPRSQDFVREFGQQWLSLDKMRTVPINRDLFPRFLYYVPLGERAGTEEPYRPTIRDYMIDETLGFVSHLIRENRGVLNIVDSDFACLNQPLAAHYGVPGVQGDEIRVVPVKPEQRLGGLLTQGSVLIGNGTGSAPHPIYRAVWLREAILGEDVPPPPSDVPALADTAGASAEKATTIKDLLVKHRQKASCNACHARLDPWGIPFEQYNAIGKFQPVVPKEGTKIRSFSTAIHKDLDGYMSYVRGLNTIAVQADADVPNGPTVNGMAELKAYLLKERKDDIARNVLKRLYAYGLGRKLSWQDRFVVDDMLHSSRKNGFGMRDMIVAICLHDSFRKPPPERKAP